MCHVTTVILCLSYSVRQITWNLTIMAQNSIPVTWANSHSRCIGNVCCLPSSTKLRCNHHRYNHRHYSRWSLYPPSVRSSIRTSAYILTVRLYIRVTMMLGQNCCLPLAHIASLDDIAVRNEKIRLWIFMVIPLHGVFAVCVCWCLLFSYPAVSVVYPSVLSFFIIIGTFMFLLLVWFYYACVYYYAGDVHVWW